MKPKVQTWLKQLNEGVIKSKTTRIIFEIHKNTYKGKGFTTIEELRKDLNMAIALRTGKFRGRAYKILKRNRTSYSRRAASNKSSHKSTVLYTTGI